MALLSNWQIAKQNTTEIVTRSVLYRMLILVDRADVRLDDGPLYVVRDYEYWMDELGVGRSQLKRAFGDLRRRGILQTKVKRAFGQTRLHLRLGRYRALQLVVNNTSTRSKTDRLIHKKDGMKDSTNQNTFGVLRPQRKKKILTKKKHKVSEVDIVAFDPADLQPTFSAVRKVWSTNWHIHCSGPVDGFPQNKKSAAMWKAWVAKVPADREPLQLVALAVANWSAFRQMVKMNKGTSIGVKPTFYHLLWNLPSLLEVGPGGDSDISSAKGDALKAEFMKGSDGGG